MRPAQRSGAGGAEAVEHDLVVLDAEALGGELVHGRHAALEVEGAAAVAAVEVVMVLLACELEARGLAGEVDRDQEALVRKALQGPIDRGDAKAGRFAPRSLQN